MESIKEKRQEVVGVYKKSLYIIDVDSIVGVSESESASSMGVSLSKSINSNKLLTYILEEAVKLPRMVDGKEIWVALISRRSFISRLVKTGILWPKSDKQIEQEEKEEERNKTRLCVRCEENYTEAKNELTACNYHPGFLFESSAQPYLWMPTPKADALRAMARAKSDKQEEPTFIYICCSRRLQEAGCRKHKHIDDEEAWEAEKESHMESNHQKLQAMMS